MPHPRKLLQHATMGLGDIVTLKKEFTSARVWRLSTNSIDVDGIAGTIFYGEIGVILQHSNRHYCKILTSSGVVGDIMKSMLLSI